MPFLKNTWYVGAWANELSSDKPFARTILGEQVLFYRDAEGQPVVLSNICPHRFAPLHKGRLENGVIECPYHGLAFGANGHCVRNPHGEGRIPSAMKIHSYPVVERFGAIWIWPGDVASADESKIPVFDFLDIAHNFIACRYLPMKANYQLMIDNVLDFSHLQFLHSSNLGTDRIALRDADCVQKDDTVWSCRLTYDEEVSPFIAQISQVPEGMLVDRSFTVRWEVPGLIELSAEMSEAGDRSKVITAAKSAVFQTPETETTAHCFLAFSMPVGLGEAGRQMLERATEALMYPIEKEDVPMVEDQQRNMGDKDFMSMRPMLLPIDEASIRCRRVMNRLLAEEANALSSPQVNLKVAV